MATLESQNYVIVRTVWTEVILLVSGRLVFHFPPTFQFAKGKFTNSDAFLNVLKSYIDFKVLPTKFY